MGEAAPATGPASDLLAEVALPLGLPGTLTYRVPPELVPRVRVGVRVAVPLVKRRTHGYVVRLHPRDPGAPRMVGLRDVLGVLEDDPSLSEEMVRFLVDAAAYYFAAPGEALLAALPRAAETRPRQVLIVRRGAAAAEGTRLGTRQRALLAALAERAEVPLPDAVRAWGVDRASVRALERRGCVILERRAVVDAFAGACSGAEEATPEPNAAQRAAISAIVGAARAGGYRGFLLHGVTASGKTEVYLRCAAEAIAAGGACLMLVPEIALTPQLVQRVRGRLGGDIAVVHSALPAAERRRAWAGMREGRVRVAVGARSALFAPLSRLALIVVDEEHDASFKQAEGFGYHARDLALLRAQRAGAVVVLGSATPSLESLHNAQVGKLTLLRLPERATPMPLPVVRLVDLRGAGRRSPRYPFLSRDLVEELGRTLARGEQAILFLNRRGFAPAAVCERCGRSVDCAGCGVALAYHRVRDALLCHYCGAERAVPERCAACGGAEFDLRGLGTERVVDAVRALYPEARVGRLDSDVAPGRASEAVLERLRRCEIDVLVGTQMVAKGHDYPGVTLVGIVHADLGLHVPDFRAAERTFQLLTQVAGRAGRGESPGLVLLQTFAPEHYAIETAARQDYEGFARAELAFRAELGYPPFGHLALIRGEGRDERRVRAAMAELAGRLGGAAEAAGVALLGPCPAPRPRLRGRWRYQLLLRGPARRAVREIVARALPWVACARGAVRGAVDIDPVHLA